MKHKTFVLLLLDSDAAYSITEQDKICGLLNLSFSKEDYFLSIYPTELNPNYRLTLAITVLRKNIEEAKAVCWEISRRLTETRHNYVCYYTYFYSGNDIDRIYFEPEISAS